MNKAKLKTYAPVARREFIQAMTDRAGYYGLTATTTEPVAEKGEVAVIGGRSFPIGVAKKRKVLEDRVKRHGFEQTMEAMAYTWFNRLVAIRFMELHGYLDHGYRVLSHPDGKPTPEILEHAEHVELPGLRKEVVIDLKLAGNKEGELYRQLLTAQCNALHSAMPFLFEKVDDESELLLPDNLLNSDSLIRKLVGEIDEEDWNEVEIIGWLYQFYISEKKDEVIGKVVASEDIPAATQLFTPNWIVKYLVQNTLGRLWMEHHPESPLKSKMEYYIEPAEQTPEVQAQVHQIIRERALQNRGLTTDSTDNTDNRPSVSVPSVSSVSSVVSSTPASVSSVVDLSLNPELLTLLDPACGSGHILVDAYDLFKAIYQERGYRARDIPALILQKNLFGMEIDDRAAQLAAFALMMKARADDRRIFDREAMPNIVAFVDSQGMDASAIYFALTSPFLEEKEGEQESPASAGQLFESDDNLFTRAEAAQFSAHRPPTTAHFTEADLAALLELFGNAKTFGSLIQVPPKLAAKLPEIEKRLDDVLKFGDLTHASAHVLKPILQQARLLARQYDAVAANPPYMGNSYYSPLLKAFVSKEFKEAKSDLYSCFITRNYAAAKQDGFVGMITTPNWMFLASFEEMRKSLLENQSIDTFVHNGRGVFGSDFGSCSFVFRNSTLLAYRGSFRRLFDKQGSVASNEELEGRYRSAKTFTASNLDFAKIPGSPIAYWVSDTVRRTFSKSPRLDQIAPTRDGITTGENERFLRLWTEIDISRSSIDKYCDRLQKTRWYPCRKGGSFRKWYGNNAILIDWEDDGFRLKNFVDVDGKRRSTPRNLTYQFKRAVSWTDVSASFFGVRQSDPGFLFETASPSCFPAHEDLDYVTGFLCSVCAGYLANLINPTVHYKAGTVAALPLSLDRTSSMYSIVGGIVRNAVSLARTDWDSSELSWDFNTLPVLQQKASNLRLSQEAADSECLARFDGLKELENQNNRLFIAAYGLENELSPAVADDHITLYRPDRAEDIKRLLSYAIGCMMGRYSLDRPGLIYAHSGNQGFDASQYNTFRADDDGIIPLLETDWGIRDDATNRFVEFINICWPGDLTTDNTDGTDEKNERLSSLSVSSVKSVVQTSPYLEENLQFVADSLGPTGSEQPRDTIRRYLATGFYKHHLSMYKKRPIYWLFSSGKQRAFQCLVYLHRYHEGTLARMRTEYVIPLQGQIAARIEQLEGDKAKATSTSHRKKLQKEQDDLKKQQKELFTFEEKLKHYADQRITLDLDDGVKVNYAKFGDLLAEARAITGGRDEE